MSKTTDASLSIVCVLNFLTVPSEFPTIPRVTVRFLADATPEVKIFIMVSNRIVCDVRWESYCLVVSFFAVVKASSPTYITLGCFIMMQVRMICVGSCSLPVYTHPFL